MKAKSLLDNRWQISGETIRPLWQVNTRRKKLPRHTSAGVISEPETSESFLSQIPYGDIAHV